MNRAIATAMFACVWVTAAAAQSAPSTSASAACLYDSRSYSDGALICVNRALMLSCSLEGGRAGWKPVTDQKLASVCEAPTVRPRVAEVPRPRHRHGIHHPVRINADRSAKCFVFNGKQYCE